MFDDKHSIHHVSINFSRRQTARFLFSFRIFGPLSLLRPSDAFMVAFSGISSEGKKLLTGMYRLYLASVQNICGDFMGIVLTLASGFSHPDLTKLTKKTKSLQNSFNFIAFRLYYGLLLYLFSLCVSLSIMIILFVFSLANQNSFLCPRLHLLSELLSCCQAARQQEKLSPQRQSQATA